MIQLSLSDSDRIAALHPLFAPLFAYVKGHDLSAVPAERITLDGDRLFINVADATLVAPEAQKLEVHRRYIDVHIPLSAPEVIGWSALSSLTVASEAPFNEADDFALYAAPASTYTTVRPGECLVVYPEDAHAPLIGTGSLRKLIAKVRID